MCVCVFVSSELCFVDGAKVIAPGKNVTIIYQILPIHYFISTHSIHAAAPDGTAAVSMYNIV